MCESIPSVLALKPELQIVSESTKCTIGQCQRQAFATLRWYRYEEEDCSCCPWYSEYVEQTNSACAGCLPKLFLIIEEAIHLYQGYIQEELDFVAQTLRAPIHAERE